MGRTIEDIYGVPFQDSDYPDGYLERFERESDVIACSEESCVCLVKERTSDRLYIARHIFPAIDERKNGFPSEERFFNYSALDRARKEVTVLERLNEQGGHPGIPAGPGWYRGEGLSISIRRYVPGITLEKFAQKGGLDRKKRPGSIYRGILSAADALHRHRAVHLDIKPENIIVGPDEQVTLIDFESSLLLDPEGSACGGSRGTRPYAAPEQLIKPYNVDVRTDIYALGVLLRFVYTGSAEYRDDRSLSEKLSAIVEKCTRPDAKDRFQSVGELTKAFEKASAESGTKSGAEFHSRLPVIAAVSAALAVFAVLLFFRAGRKQNNVSAARGSSVTEAAEVQDSSGTPEAAEVLVSSAAPAAVEVQDSSGAAAAEESLLQASEAEISQPVSENEAQFPSEVPEPESAADAHTAGTFYVYKDFGSGENHFPEKMQMQSPEGVSINLLDENHPAGQASGDTCIRCEAAQESSAWCGYAFLNGVYDEDSKTMKLNDGMTAGQGMHLTGAKELRFLARGEAGGEQTEFFCCGFGYDGETGTVLVPFPDSSKKRTTGILSLSANWKEYSISLEGADLENISCGFGYVTAGSSAVIYLDEIRFIY